ncbi:hypothetical protein [Garicola koreensis]|uniref:LppP/LprE lipoprotein n=1 Tax=Garicola koreensis TaxID=1262554 RepID=A0A7W5TT07_9MICC|nr:hypothetical protein [Garicola koreensis]MBB3666913.1 hypothetical protein [Garicola koreensis]
MKKTDRTTFAAALALVGLLAAGCADVEPSSAPPSESSEPAETEAAEPEEWEPHDDLFELWIDDDTGPAAAYEAVLDMGYSPDGNGIIELPGAADWATAPNSELWDVDVFYDLDVLVEERAPATPDREMSAVDCVTEWEDVDALALQSAPEGNATYGPGADAGPTCFDAPGGAPTAPAVRHVHYLCQAANTTARALVSHIDEEAAVWTPEQTTGKGRQCFGFGGDEVAVHQVEVVNHQVGRK